MEPLDQTRLAFALAVLSYGAITDLRKREVANELWLFGLPIGFSLTALSLTLRFDVQTLLMIVASAGSAVLLGLALFYVGFAGGADAKALMFLGLSLPLYPSDAFEPPSPVLPFFPITVFNNAILLSLSVPVMVALRNLSEGLKGEGGSLEERRRAPWGSLRSSYRAIG